MIRSGGLLPHGHQTADPGRLKLLIYLSPSLQSRQKFGAMNTRKVSLSGAAFSNNVLRSTGSSNLHTLLVTSWEQTACYLSINLTQKTFFSTKLSNVYIDCKAKVRLQSGYCMSSWREILPEVGQGNTDAFSGAGRAECSPIVFVSTEPKCRAAVFPCPITWCVLSQGPC